MLLFLTMAKPQRAQAAEEGQARCLSCEAESANARKLEMQKFARELMESYNKNKKPKQTGCISCGKVEVAKKGQVSLSVTTDDVWSRYPEIMNYSNSAKVQKMINKALAETSVQYIKAKGKVIGTRSKNPTKSYGQCLQHAKIAMHAGGLTSEYGNYSRVNRETGYPKKNLVGHLERQGFKDILNDPKYGGLITSAASAPKGALLVYEGGTEGGHVEIKTEFGNKGRYVSDFQSELPIIQNTTAGLSSRRYKLIGVLVQTGK